MYHWTIGAKFKFILGPLPEGWHKAANCRYGAGVFGLRNVGRLNLFYWKHRCTLHKRDYFSSGFILMVFHSRKVAGPFFCFDWSLIRPFRDKGLSLIFSCKRVCCKKWNILSWRGSSRLFFCSQLIRFLWKYSKRNARDWYEIYSSPSIWKLWIVRSAFNLIRT